MKLSIYEENSYGKEILVHKNFTFIDQVKAYVLSAGVPPFDQVLQQAGYFIMPGPEQRLIENKIKRFLKNIGINYSLIVASLHQLTYKFYHVELNHLH